MTVIRPRAKLAKVAGIRTRVAAGLALAGPLPAVASVDGLAAIRTRVEVAKVHAIQTRVAAQFAA